ncbi:MAG: threonine synthase [Spirochaetes bacterium]|nr:threonine synthase [Spirochaetota bacterium]
MARAWFQSINPQHTQKYALDEVIYRDPKSGDLLEVRHDMHELSKTSAQAWRELFDSRWRSHNKVDASGIWGKREWVLPDLPVDDIVTLGEGATALFSGDELSKQFGHNELYVKLCGNSHTGSFKDLGMTVLVSQVNHMIKNGAPIRAIACASTGDTSAALAAYAAYAGILSVILLPKNKISLAQLMQPIANGSLVLALDTDFDGCMQIVQELTHEKEIYLANSMNSLRIEGQKTVGIEVAQQLGRQVGSDDWRLPDWFIIPGGNLGNVSALGAGLKMLYDLKLVNSLPRIAVAQAAAANPLYLSYQKNFADFQAITAGETQASAIRIGNPISVKKAIHTLKEFGGVVEQASEAELANAAALGDLSGLLVDPHTGVALAALQKLKKGGVIKDNESVCVISTAHGLKFADFKIGYHAGSLGAVEANHTNTPVDLKASLGAVKDAVAKFLDQKH